MSFLVPRASRALDGDDSSQVAVDEGRARDLHCSAAWAGMNTRRLVRLTRPRSPVTQHAARESQGTVDDPDRDTF